MSQLYGTPLEVWLKKAVNGVLPTPNTD